MGISEFDDAYEDDHSPRERQEQRLGEAILSAPIRALEPRAAASVKEGATIREAIQLMLEREVGAALIERGGLAVGIFTPQGVPRRGGRRGVHQRRGGRQGGRRGSRSPPAGARHFPAPSPQAPRRRRLHSS